MAIADNGLVGIRSLVDLQELEIPPGENELSLTKSYYGNALKVQSVTDKPMPKSAFVIIHKNGLINAGCS
jgi:hypothetical protein